MPEKLGNTGRACDRFSCKILPMQQSDPDSTSLAVMECVSPNAPVSPTISEDSTPEPDHLIPPLSRAIDLTAMFVPFIVFVVGVALLWDRAINWMQVGLMIGMYLFTGFGVTVGFHRLFTHRAFETGPTVRIVLAILGSLSVQGPLLWWVALHRRHHHHSDAAGDPHSPHLHGGRGFRARLAGAWHSHVGWLLKPDEPGATRYVLDLLKGVRSVHHQQALPALGGAEPAGAGGAERADYTNHGGGDVGFRVGRIGAGVSRPPYYLERELGMPSVGKPTVQKQ